jgi:hypothetical protein
MPKVELGSFFDEADSWFTGFLDTTPKGPSLAPVTDLSNEYPSEFRHDSSVDHDVSEVLEDEDEGNISADMKEILPEGIDRVFVMPVTPEIQDPKSSDMESACIVSEASDINVRTVNPKKTVQFKVCLKSLNFN